MEFSLEEFCNAPTLDILHRRTKDQLIIIADHLESFSLQTNQIFYCQFTLAEPLWHFSLTLNSCQSRKRVKQRLWCCLFVIFVFFSCEHAI